MRILVVEDEKDLNQVISKRLSAQGYSVDSCYNGKEALLFLSTGEFDIVIMDIMMPEMSGIEALKTMRDQNNNSPVLMLTAKDTIEDRVQGLDLGADDYMIKPFSLDELLARVRALTRKATGNHSNILAVGDLVIDIRARTVKRAGKEIVLSAKEYDIFEYLVMNKGVVLSREKIENHVWNFDYSGGTNVVDVYIRYLRKKIDDDFDKKLIHTVRSVGYVIRSDS